MPRPRRVFAGDSSEATVVQLENLSDARTVIPLECTHSGVHVFEVMNLGGSESVATVNTIVLCIDYNLREAGVVDSGVLKDLLDLVVVGGFGDGGCLDHVSESRERGARIGSMDKVVLELLSTW